jgi:hypothetical protein
MKVTSSLREGFGGIFTKIQYGLFGRSAAVFCRATMNLSDRAVVSRWGCRNGKTAGLLVSLLAAYSLKPQ